MPLTMTPIRRALRILTLLLSPVAIPAGAQTIIEIGTGAGVNLDTEFPAPYGNQAFGSRHQMLFRASELIAAGMAEGTIHSLAFNVATEAGTTLMGFTIGLGTTTQDQLMGNQYLPGITTVWGPLDFADQAGWNTHTLPVPFYWDGVSNLVVQTCFSNGSNTINAQMYHTPTSYTSVVYRATTNPNVCSSNFGNIIPSILRPDMRFEWNPPMLPPQAAFSMSTSFTCDGVVAFTDESILYPTGWFWDFGDGQTDTAQHPVHVYGTDGTFTVTLIDTNAYGSDTATAEVVVNVNGPHPQPASCAPNTTTPVAGFGIMQVSYGDVVYPSADAYSEGYEDRGCVTDTVLSGGSFDLTVATGTVTTHNVRAWVDWDNNATFGSAELVLSADNVTSATASVYVPAAAMLDTALRIRVIADYDLSMPPEPCADPQYGQAEDYGLVIIENPLPPVAAIGAEPQFSCDGHVQFTDLSANAPSAWWWDFGDGQTSTAQDPQHLYLASGTYTVVLAAINVNGTDTLTLVDLITVDLAGQLVPAACIPQTQSYCCGYGILAVSFAGIASTSVDGTEGYVDRSCGNQATVIEGSPYPIAINTDNGNNSDVYVWIDLDNDGDFIAGELLFTGLNDVDPSGTITIPYGAVYNTPLRMRVSNDVIGELAGPCDQPLWGQAEDFAVVIEQNTSPPVAGFSASPLVTCDGVVVFTDESTNLPNSWLWDFGDGDTSPDQDPTHTYLTPGTYTVSLTATNAFGSDVFTVAGLIQYIVSDYCDTTWTSPDMDQTLSDCFGVLTDDGGPFADYSPGPSGAMTIAPPGAQWITLTFSQFAWETNFDWLNIYDGPDVFSPLIGSFTGAGVGQLPNDGVITSTGPSITVQQDASFGPNTWEGFIATWNCSVVGVEEQAADPLLSLWPQPSDGPVQLMLSRPAAAGEQVTIHNALGATAWEAPLQAGARAFTFDLSRLSPGCYSFTLRSASGAWTRSLVLH